MSHTAAVGVGIDCSTHFHDAVPRGTRTLAPLIPRPLLVLLNVLLVVTRSLTGAQRQLLLDLTRTTTEEYDPHSRETALNPHDAVN